MKLSVKVITLHECASVYGNIVNDKNMCTRGILTGSGTCQVFLLSLHCIPIQF